MTNFLLRSCCQCFCSVSLILISNLFFLKRQLFHIIQYTQFIRGKVKPGGCSLEHYPGSKTLASTLSPLIKFLLQTLALRLPGGFFSVKVDSFSLVFDPIKLHVLSRGNTKVTSKRHNPLVSQISCAARRVWEREVKELRERKGREEKTRREMVR